MPSNAPQTTTVVSDARLIKVIRVPRDKVLLLVADCTVCGRTVTHGGGFDAQRLADFLGARSAHCLCDVTTLVDPDNVIGAYLSERA